MNQQPCVYVIGPTASGKSDLAIELAKRWQGEVVNADSMQVYCELNIGSAKVPLHERQGIVHHLLDVVHVGEPFSVAAYKSLAEQAMEGIHRQGHLPIVCGGTGLYIQALSGRLNFTQVESDPVLRSELQTYAREHGRQALHERLRAVDPDSAQRLHPNDQKRVIRALEVSLLTHKPYSAQTETFAQQAYQGGKSPCMLGLYWPREQLRARIGKRVDSMMEQGLLEEARDVFALGVDIEHPSMQGLGYRQLFRYFLGQYTLSEAVERIKIETAQFAKRQMTWFKRDLRIHWLDMQALMEDDACLAQADRLVSDYLTLRSEVF